MEYEGICLHQLSELFCGEVVAHIGKTKAAGYACSARCSSEHDCLGHAISITPGDDIAGLERFLPFQIDLVRVIPDLIPNSVKNGHALLKRGLFAVDSIYSKIYNLHCIAIYEIRGLKVLLQIIFHVCLYLIITN